MIAQMAEQVKVLGGNCIPDFDCFSQKLLELNLKWIVTSTFFALDASGETIAKANPFRIFIGIYWSSGSGTARVGLTKGLSLSGGGKAINAACHSLEFNYSQHGPMPMQEFGGFSTGGTTFVQVYEGIWTGNVKSSCKEG